MKTQHRLIVCFIGMTFSGAASSSPVELSVALQTVDPCEINPDRCKKPGRPIEPAPPDAPPEPAPDPPNPPPPPPPEPPPPE